MLTSFFTSLAKLLITGIVGMVVIFMFTTNIANAQNAKDAVCAGLGAVAGSSDCSDPEDSTTLGGTVGSVINILSLLVGVISVVMVIVGGLKYVTSQGESGATASAKNTIIYAMVGLIIVALSQILVRFVLLRATTEAQQPAANAGTILMIRN